MTNLNFDDYFYAKENSRGQRYSLSERNEADFKKETDIFFYPTKDKERLFIIIGDTSYHKNSCLHIQNRQTYLRGTKTISGISKLVDICKIPIIITLSDSQYLIGKGFIAKYHNEEIEILFAACIPTNKVVTDMIDVKFYVSRKINSDQVDKKITKVIQKLINNHTGDVIISNSIDSYIGHTIQYPSFRHLPERKEYFDKLTTHCIEKLRKSL